MSDKGAQFSDRSNEAEMAEENTGVVDGSEESPTPTEVEANLGTSPASAETSPRGESTTGSETPENVPFHKHPRFKELTDSNKELKQKVKALESELTKQTKPELNPVELALSEFKASGVDEKSAKILAPTIAKVADAVASRKVSAVEAAAYQMVLDSRVDKFAKEHEDYEDIQPRMAEIYNALDESHQDFLLKSPLGLEFLYAKAKADASQEELDKAFKKGVQQGYTTKKLKEAGSPSGGATVRNPSSELTEEAIASMSIEEYTKRRSEILASRAPKKR